MNPLADGTKPDSADDLPDKLIPRVIVHDQKTQELAEKLLDLFKDGFRYAEGNIFQKFAIRTFLRNSFSSQGQTLGKILAS